MPKPPERTISLIEYPRHFDSQKEFLCPNKPVFQKYSKAFFSRNSTFEVKYQGEETTQRSQIEHFTQPKRPRNSFIYYHKEKCREFDGSEKYSNFIRKLSKNWQSLPPADKQKYEELSRADHERYRHEMESFRGNSRLLGADFENKSARK